MPTTAAAPRPCRGVGMHAWLLQLLPWHRRLPPGASTTVRAGRCARLACLWQGEKKRAAGVVGPAARLRSSRVDWLAQPICQIWHKVVSAVLHELFQLCFSRCAAPAITRPKFPLACALFTTLLKDRQQTHIRQAHVSLVTFTRHLQLSNWGDLSMLETAIALIVGFALGYGVRGWLSRRRRQAERRRREAFGT